MKKVFGVFLVVAAILAGSSAVMAQTPGFGVLFYEGGMVRTVVPPAAMTKLGRDDLYVVTSPVVLPFNQLPIAAVAPGDQDYHGGKWAFWAVEWKMGIVPDLLMSEADVLDARDAGDVTVTRVEANDFKCPIQP